MTAPLEGLRVVDPERVAGCGPDCPCCQPLTFGGSRVVYSTGVRYELVELPWAGGARVFVWRVV